MLSNIFTYEMNITSDDFINKKIETKDKWNQLYLLSMEYVLGVNCRIPNVSLSEKRL